jgi:hypothetical protein
MSEWQTISKGKKGKRSGAYVPPAVNSELLRRGRAAAVLVTTEKSCEAVVAEVRRCLGALRGSAYFGFVREQLRRHCGQAGFGCVLGLGIGSLSSDTSVLQLALYLLLCEALLPAYAYDNAAEDLPDGQAPQAPPLPPLPPAPLVSPVSPDPSPCMGVFDPHISAADEEAYLQLRVPVLRDNLRGKHVTHAQHGRTLFFLPHCPHRLYCNLLWANWEALDRLFIFGNR